MIALNDEHYPFVLMSFRVGECSADDYRALFERFRSIATRAIRNDTCHVTISVSTGGLSPKDRKLVGELTNGVPRAELDRTLGAFVVDQRAAVRGIITALRWISPKMPNLRAVSSVEHALDAALACLASRAITVDPRLRERSRAWLLHETRASKGETLAEGREH
jgi:hypothetical protein